MNVTAKHDHEPTLDNPFSKPNSPRTAETDLNGTETYSPHWRALLGPDTEKVDAHGRQ